MRSRPILTIILIGMAVALAGCGGGEGGTTAPPTPPNNPEPPPPDPGVVTSPPPPAATPPPPPSAAPPPQRIAITVVGGRPRGGIARPAITHGRRVVLVVRSDVADEIHVHGYDVSEPVAAGGRVVLRFAATIPGRFEVELEERGVPLAELTVS